MTIDRLMKAMQRMVDFQSCVDCALAHVCEQEVDGVLRYVGLWSGGGGTTGSVK